MKYKLSVNDQKQIAHFVAQRYAATMSSSGMYFETTDIYIDMFNQIMDKTDQYNESIKD